MIFDNEKDLLWEELNLEGLLDSMKVQNQSLKVVDDAPKSVAMQKHNKMINKPSYSVIMDRYNSSPHKPISVQAAKINRLADPIKGRYPHFDKYMNTDTLTTYDEEPVSFKKNNSNSNSPIRSTSNSPMKKANAGGSKTPPAAFFLTEGLEDDAADDRYSPNNSRIQQADKIVANKLKAGNGFAAILRSRVEEANRLERLQVPVKLESTKPQKPSIYGNRGGRVVGGGVSRARAPRQQPNKSMPKQSAPLTKQRRNWQENTIVHHVRGESNKKTIAQVVAGKKNMLRGKRLDEDGGSIERRRNAGLLKDPLTKKVKKIVSSGYGAVSGYNRGAGGGNAVSNTSGKARERVIRKITTDGPAPSVTDNPNPIADIKKKLRSKDTIDVLDTIEEKRSILLQSGNGKRGGKAGGTQSAPPGKSRERSGGRDGSGNNQSLDEEDESARPAVRMTRKSANPPMRKAAISSQQPQQQQQQKEEHWTQKLSPKQVHPNSYLQQKRDEARQQQLQPSGNGGGAPKPSANVTSQFTVVRNVDLSSALTASSLSPRSNRESGVVSSTTANELKEDSKVSRSTKHTTSSGGGDGREPAADIQTTLAKLRSFEGMDVAVSGSTKNSNAKNGRVEVDINTQFARQAAKLGEYFNNAESIMNKYKNLANDLE